MSKLLTDLANPVFLQICNNITGERQTAGDLYSYVVLLLFDSSIEQSDEEELKKIFYKYARDEFNWAHSNFNALYRRKDGRVINLNDKATKYAHTGVTVETPLLENFPDTYEPRSEQEMYLLDVINNEIEKPQLDKRDFMVRETMRLYLEMGSFQKVADATGLNVSTVYRLFKEFKEDVRNNNNCNFSNQDTAGLV